MYNHGTIYHGSNTQIGNLWIITGHGMPNASLLWNGRAKRPCMDALSKHADMGPNNVVASEAEVLRIMGSTMVMPAWALNIIDINTYPMFNNLVWSGMPLLPVLSPPSAGNGSLTKRTGYQRFQLPPDLLPLIQKNLGIPLTTPPEPVKVKTNTCNHDFVNYVGLTEVYRYCRFCDAKDGTKGLN